MGFLNLSAFKLRPPLPHYNRLSPIPAYSLPATQRIYGQGFEAQNPDLVWKFSVARRADSDLEVDAFVSHVLNAASGLAQPSREGKVVRTLKEFWEEEKNRRISRRVQQGASWQEAERIVAEEMSQHDPIERKVEPGRACSEPHLLEALDILRARETSEGGAASSPTKSQPPLAPQLSAPLQLSHSGGTPARAVEMWTQTYRVNNVDFLSEAPAPPPTHAAPDDELLVRLIAAAEASQAPEAEDVDDTSDEEASVKNFDSDLVDIAECSQPPEQPPDGESGGKSQGSKRKSSSGLYSPLPLTVGGTPVQLPVSTAKSRRMRKLSETQETTPSVIKETAVEVQKGAESGASHHRDDVGSHSPRRRLVHSQHSLSSFSPRRTTSDLLSHGKQAFVLVPHAQPPQRSETIATMAETGLAPLVTPVPFYGNPQDAPEKAKHFGGKLFKIPSGDPKDLPPAPVLFKGSQSNRRAKVRVVVPSTEPPTRGALRETLGLPKSRGAAVYETRIDSYGREVRFRVVAGSDQKFETPRTLQSWESRTENDSLLNSARRRPRADFESDDSSDERPALSADLRALVDESAVEPGSMPDLAQRPPSPKYDEAYQPVPAAGVTESAVLRRKKRRVSVSQISLRHSPEKLKSTNPMTILERDSNTEAGTIAAPPSTTGLHVNQGLSIAVIELLADSRRDLLPDPRYDEVRAIAVFFRHEALRDGTNDKILLIVRPPDGCEFSLLPAALSEDIEIHQVETETLLFEEFVDLTAKHDPDIIAGWEVQMASVGYLADRAAEIGIDLNQRISRMRDPQRSRRTLNENTDGKNVAVEYLNRKQSIQSIVGRHILNVWRLARSEVKLPCYTFENVVAEVLRKRVPFHSNRDLTRWFRGSYAEIQRSLGYICHRACTTMSLVDELDIIGRTGELARVFGLDFMSVLTRGSQFRVESIMARAAHTTGLCLMAASREQVYKQPALECLPLVMEPESAYYTDPVLVLDFQSLYPSMIIAHNLCFSTMLGSVRVDDWKEQKTIGVVTDYFAPKLSDLGKDVFISPNGQAFVTANRQRGILPQMLTEILDTRVMVKKSMKMVDGEDRQSLLRLLNARQFGLKMIANVTYGYTSASFSGRMPCATLADSIVQSGHSALNHCVEVIEEKWRSLGARVVYGDTDSLFVQLPGATRELAFRVGNEISNHISSLYPSPIKLQFEKVYHPCFLVTKKRYVGYAFESETQSTPVLDAKGVETIRRDSCAATRKMLEQSLRLLFETNDLSIVKRKAQRQWKRILAGRVTIEDFIFRQEVRMGSYKEGHMPPAAIVASKRMDADPRANPRHGERIEYVVVFGPPGATLRQLVVSPEELLQGQRRGTLRLNATYYITKQIIPALERLFSLLGADVRAWFSEMPRPHFKATGRGGRTKGTMHSFYLSTKCILCGGWCEGLYSERGSVLDVSVCAGCAKDRQSALFSIAMATNEQEIIRKRLTEACLQCTQSADPSQIRCTSLDCSIFFAREKSILRISEARKNFLTLSAEWGGESR